MQHLLTGVRRLCDITQSHLDALNSTIDWARAVHRDTWNEPYEGATDPRANAEQIAKAMAKHGVPREIWEARIDELIFVTNLLDQLEKVLLFAATIPEVIESSVLSDEWVVKASSKAAHRAAGTFWAFYMALAPDQRRDFHRDIENILIPGRGIYLGCDGDNEVSFHPVAQAVPASLRQVSS